MTIDAILYALEQLAFPSARTLWLYGDPPSPCDIYHPLKDHVPALERKGCNVLSGTEKIEGEYGTVILDCPRQREEAEGLLALALTHSTARVMAAAPNAAGGGRLAGMMDAYGVPFHSLSKHKCRIVWTDQATRADKGRTDRHLHFLLPRPVTQEALTWWTVPGLFGWDKIDIGSRLLLEHLPPDIAGDIADFGCGYGYISLMLERRYPAIASIDAYDNDARALLCCAQGGGTKIRTYWCDIRTLEERRRYDAIVMNPPFHSAREENQGLGAVFIAKACRSLKPGGRLFCVANRHLPYEKTVPGLKSLFEGGGYKILYWVAP